MSQKSCIRLLRLSVLITALIIICCKEKDTERLIYFDMPSQEISSALNTFIEKTDLSIVYSIEDKENIVTNSVMGLYTAEQALKIMLKDTGLSYFRTGGNTISIRKNDGSMPDWKAF